MNTLLNWQSLTILAGGFGTLAIFSFLIRENPVYRFFEHLFIGISAGFLVIYGIKNTLWPQVLVPMLGLDIYQFPDGSFNKEYQPLYLLYILPMLFGLLYYFVYSKNYGWLAKLVIGFSLGASGGLAFKAFFNQYLPQISSSFKPLLVFEGGVFNIYESINNTIFVATVLLVLYYFFFSFRKQKPIAAKADKLARIMMMICFGAFFGSTVMARMALLVERLQFLIFDWFGVLRSLF